MKIVSLNLNGIRAAHRKGVATWLAGERPDVLCVQELKAQEKDMTDEMRAPAGMTGAFAFAERAGYSGVGIYSAAGMAPDRIETRFGDAVMDGEGRFILAEYGALTVASLYMPSGSSGDARQKVKYDLMEKVGARLARYMQEARAGGREFVLCADWNIAHTQKDIRNWRGNQKNSGFLPDEREWVSGLLAAGWVDVFRELNDAEGEYTWWSNRGNAWANNVGWRIDYQLATPGVAATARAARIYKDERFSDHAPLVIEYEWQGG